MRKRLTVLMERMLAPTLPEPDPKAKTVWQAACELNAKYPIGGKDFGPDNELQLVTVPRWGVTPVEFYKLNGHLHQKERKRYVMPFVMKGPELLDPEFTLNVRGRCGSVQVGRFTLHSLVIMQPAPLGQDRSLQEFLCMCDLFTETT